MQGEINIAIVISAVSIMLTVYNTIMGQKRLNKADTQNDTASMTMVLVKLENIEKVVSEIKSEMNVMRRDHQALRDMVITNKNSLDSAWHRIDEILQKIGSVS